MVRRFTNLLDLIDYLNKVGLDSEDLPPKIMPHIIASPKPILCQGEGWYKTKVILASCRLSAGPPRTKLDKKWL